MQITWGRGEEIGEAISRGDYVTEADLDLSVMNRPDGCNLCSVGGFWFLRMAGGGHAMQNKLFK